MLGNDGRAQLRVLFQQLGNGRFPGFDLVAAFSMGRFRCWRVEILRQRAAADMQMPRDPAQGPLLHPVEAMQFADLIRGEHLRDL